MAMWLYQLNHQSTYPVEDYRRDIWENERWRWPVERVVGAEQERPRPGDMLVTYYAHTTSAEPGFFGWAVVTEYREGDECPLVFRPVAPSDQLKMHPWWDDAAQKLAKEARPGRQGTLFRVKDEDAAAIRAGIARWMGWAWHPALSEKPQSA